MSKEEKPKPASIFREPSYDGFVLSRPDVFVQCVRGRSARFREDLIVNIHKYGPRVYVFESAEEQKDE